MERRTLSYGMVGGSVNAFIGGVHRTAIAFDGTTFLKAGCFSQNNEVNRETGEFLKVDNDRIYSSYEEMAEKEAQREDKIDFVVITTPNKTHYDIAKTFIEKGFNVVCEKPLCHTVEQAEELSKLAKEKKVLFAVTYSYTGNAMVKQAKKIIEDGEIGDIINVSAEFLQEWLIDDVGAGDQTTKRLSMWRKDPEIAGISNCVGDLGTHAEHLVYYLTGLKLKKVSAVLDYFGQPLEMNANMLLEYENGAHGVYSFSQVCVGHSNGLTVRIFGTKGAIEWVQENPNLLYVTKKGQPMQIYNRGMGYLNGRAAELNRIPSGHPEGLYVAFANLYKTYIGAVLKKINGEELSIEDLDFPTIDEGVDSIKFIHAVVKSNNEGSTWVQL